MITKKDKLQLKIVMGICAISSIALIIFYLIDMFNGDTLMYFNQHFSIAICLSLIGIIAMLMPILGKQKFSDNRQDNMIVIVGVLLILCGIISIIYSYMNLGF